MKVIFLFLFLFSHCFSFVPSKSQINLEKRWRFGEYLLITGSDRGSPLIEIFRYNEIVFKQEGGDADYGDIDSLDINKDNMMDFIFEYRFEDGNELAMLVSDQNTYKIVKITGVILKKYNCSTKPYSQNDSKLKSFILTDVNKDGNKDILTMAVRTNKGLAISTGCSRTILYQEIVQKSHLDK